MITLSEAAKLAGVSSSALFKAIKRGRLSAVRDDAYGQYRVDVSELSRVYPLKSAQSQTPEIQRESPEVLSERVRALERMVSTLEDERDDLRRRLDGEAEERRRLTHLLTHEPEKSSDTPLEPHPHWPHWKKTVLAVVLGVIAAAAWNARQPGETQPQKQPAIELKPQAPNLEPQKPAPKPDGETWKPDDGG